MRLLVFVAIAACAVAALTSCADETPAPAASTTVAPAALPSPAPEESEGPGEEELVAAVRDYSDACLGGEARASWEMRSERLRERMSLSEWKNVVAMLTLTYGDVTLENVTVVDLAGGMARVTYRYSDPELDQVKEPWVVEEGEWHVDE